MAERPASLDFNQACNTKFAAVLPFCSCKNTSAFSLSSVKFFCALQAVSGHLYRFCMFTVAATIVRDIFNYASPFLILLEFLILHHLAKTIMFWATHN